MSTPKIPLVFIIITSLILSTCYGKYMGKSEFESLKDNDEDEINWDSDEDDCDRYNWSWCYDYDDWRLSTGAIIGIVIAGLVITCLPIILCYCCAWCCFATLRGSKPVPSQVVVAAPQTQQYPYPTQNTAVTVTSYPANPPSNPAWQSSNVGPTPSPAPYPVTASPTPYPVQPYSGYNTFPTPINNSQANSEQLPNYYEAVGSSNTSIGPQQGSTQELGWKTHHPI